MQGGTGHGLQPGRFPRFGHNQQGYLLPQQRLSLIRAGSTNVCNRRPGQAQTRQAQTMQAQAMHATQASNKSRQVQVIGADRQGHNVGRATAVGQQLSRAGNSPRQLVTHAPDPVPAAACVFVAFAACMPLPSTLPCTAPRRLTLYMKTKTLKTVMNSTEKMASMQNCARAGEVALV